MTASFVRELLLGPDRVKPAQRIEIGRYFVEVITKRGFPLHVANLWNALYFGWDPDEDGYIGQGLNPDRIVKRTFGAEDRPVPVGGFVKLTTDAMEVWGEVVYKEGRHPDVDPASGEFPGWVSGADAVVSDGVVRVREALIIDWCAFGQTLNDPVDLARLRKRGRLDEQGHLVMTALYAPHEAELDDTAYFARYLVDQHREGLLAEFVESGIGDDDLYALLLVSLRAVADIASRTTGLVVSAPYVALSDDYRALVNDNSADQRTGHDFFRSVVTHIVSIPTAANVSYASAGLAVMEHLSRGDGLDLFEAQLLDGPGYARLVTYTNLFIAAEVQADRYGVIRRYADGPYHLRLDDPWQWGSIWRSERVSLDRLPAYAHVPPLVPLGLGAEELRPREAFDAAPTEPEPAVVILGDRKSWLVTLSDRNIDEGTLPLGSADRLLGRLAGGEFRLKIGIEGRRSDLLFNGCVRVDSRRHVIAGIRWGLEAFAGLHLYCSAGRDGFSVWAELRPLVPPQWVAGVEYAFEFGGRPAPRARAQIRDLAYVHTLRDALALAFRQRGEALPDGSFAASLMELARAIVGASVDTAFLSRVAHEIRTMDLDQLPDGRYVWHPRVSNRTRSTDTTLLNNFAATEHGARATRFIRPHVRRMHLRRWDHKDPADWERRCREYPDALARFHADGVKNPVLPRGWTWVSQSNVRGNPEG